MIGLFIKKICENRLRTTLIVVIFSLSLFLAYFFGTLGFNILREIKSISDSNVNYKYIYAELTDSVDDTVLVKDSDMNKVSATRTVQKTISFMKCDKIDVSVAELSTSYDMTIPGGNLVEGKEISTPQDTLIGKSILDYYNYEYSDVIGESLLIENVGTYIIVGVYDDTDEKFNAGCIVSSDKQFDFEEYVIETNNIKNVENISIRLEKKGYKVSSYASEIAEEQQYTYIIATIIAIITIFIVIFACAMLYCALTTSLMDMYPFIAMIKAVGYKKTDYAKVVYAESIMIILPSSVIVTVLYCFGMPVIGFLFRWANIKEIQGISVDKITSINPFILILGILVVVVGMLIIEQFCIRKLEKLQVGDILCEANQ